MADTESGVGVKSLSIWFSAIYYLLAGVYALAFPVIFDLRLVPLEILGALCLVSSFGILRMKRWAIWLGLALAPLVFVTGLVSFEASAGFAGFNPNTPTMLFHLSLIFCAIFSIPSFILILGKRRQFK